MAISSRVQSNPFLSVEPKTGSAIQSAAPAETSPLLLIKKNLGVSVPDKVAFSAQATNEFYKRALARYQQRRQTKLTRFGSIALETLQTLRPSIVAILDRPYLEDPEMGKITGRTILSLIKEGAERRPNCVLTNNYMAEMLGAFDEQVHLATVNTQLPEASANDMNGMSADERREKALAALETAIQDLESAHLIQTEARDDSQLLNPKSPKKAGQESLFDSLMMRRNRLMDESQRHLTVESFEGDLKHFQNNRYVMDIIYFIDKDFKGITGWDILSLVVASEGMMLGNVPQATIAAFFDTEHESAAQHAIGDLIERVRVLESSTQNDIAYVQSRPYAKLALKMRR